MRLAFNVLLVVVVLVLGLDAQTVRLRFVGASPPGGGGDVFQADFSSGAQPNAGFAGVSGSAEHGVVITKTYTASGGPGGVPTYRYDYLHDASQLDVGNGYGGEFYLGWGVDMGAAPGSGVARYIRLKFRVVSGSNCRAHDSFDGTSPVAMRTKLYILGDGASGRSIIDVECEPDASTYRIRMQRDGGTEGEVTGLGIGTAYNVQVEAVSGASGSLRIWVNNNTYGSPNAESLGLSMGAATWDQFGFGYYSNRMITSSGSFGLEYWAAEVGTTFDASW